METITSLKSLFREVLHEEEMILEHKESKLKDEIRNLQKEIEIEFAEELWGENNGRMEKNT